MANGKLLSEPAGELQAVLFNLAWPSLGCYHRNAIQKSKARLRHCKCWSLHVKTKHTICLLCMFAWKTFIQREVPTCFFWVDISICASVVRATFPPVHWPALPFPSAAVSVTNSHLQAGCVSSTSFVFAKTKFGWQVSVQY